MPRFAKWSLLSRDWTTPRGPPVLPLGRASREPKVQQTQETGGREALLLHTHYIFHTDNSEAEQAGVA